MASTAGLTEVVLYDTLVNYLVSMARAVEGAMNRSLDALVGLDNPRTAGFPGNVFLLEPRINEMEVFIDEHAIRLLRRGDRCSPGSGPHLPRCKEEKGVRAERFVLQNIHMGFKDC